MWGLGRNIGRCIVLQAEFWTIYDDLQIVWEDKWANVIIETDCALTIKCIHGDHKGRSNRDLILRIHKLCKHKWRVLIKQASRKVNSVADILANLMKDSPLARECFMWLLHRLTIRYGSIDVFGYPT